MVKFLSLPLCISHYECDGCGSSARASIVTIFISILVQWVRDSCQFPQFFFVVTFVPIINFLACSGCVRNVKSNWVESIVQLFTHSLFVRSFCLRLLARSRSMSRVSHFSHISSLSKWLRIRNAMKLKCQMRFPIHAIHLLFCRCHLDNFCDAFVNEFVACHLSHTHTLYEYTMSLLWMLTIYDWHSSVRFSSHGKANKNNQNDRKVIDELKMFISLSNNGKKSKSSIFIWTKIKRQRRKCIVNPFDFIRR